jgi:four helix bundle protein
MAYKSYKNLEAYQLAHQLAIEIHQLSLKLPPFELYEEGAQIRRSSKSVANNLVEGFSRKRYKNDFIQFLTQALASCNETVEHLDFLFETKSLIEEKKYHYLKDGYEKLGRKINKFIQAVEVGYLTNKSRIQRPTSSGKNKAISILFVILIIGAILTSALLVSDILIRHGRVTKGIENSELPFFAAESGIEKVAYQVFKEHCHIGSNCGVSGSLWPNGPTYEVQDDDIQAELTAGPWSFSLAPGQSFSLYLDLCGPAYPASLTITGEADSDLTIFKEVIATAETSETVYSDLSSPIVISIDRDNDDRLIAYYKITIHNRHSTNSQNYSLNWVGNLPTALKISQAKGTYKNYQRLIEQVIPRWQKTGS